MSKKSRAVTLVTASILSLALSAPLLAQGKITIGWACMPPEIAVIAEAVDGAKATAEKLGVEINFGQASGASAQANAIDGLLAAKVNVLAIDPEDSTAIGSSVKKANEVGIPVVMFVGDTLGGGETATFIASDEETGGYQMAKWAFERLGGKGKIALIQGAKAHQAGQLRENGFRKALQEYPGIELVGYGEAAWMRDKANVLASDILSRDPSLQMFVVLSDDMAAGVYSAVKAAGSTALISGYNGSCEILNKIWNGEVTATLHQGWRDIGSQVIQAGFDIANGKTVEKRITMPSTVIDKPTMQAIVENKVEATEGLKKDVDSAVNGCKS